MTFRDWFFRLRRVAAGCVVLLALAMVGAVGFYLARTQSEARDRILGDFDARAQLVAGVTSDTVTASDTKTREWATTTFAGPAADLTRVLDVQRVGIAWLAVLRADGKVLSTSPRSQAGRAAGLPNSPGFRLAVTSGRLSYGDVTMENGTPMLYAFQPFPTTGGTRVVIIPAAVSDVADVLRTTLDVTASRTYIVDSTGSAIAATDDTAVGRPIPDTKLAAAAKRIGSGVIEGNYYFSLPVTGTAWRVIIATSRAELLAPVQQTNRVAWLIFAGFAGAVTLILVIGAATLISSARLAHARLHDTLTGLPNRALFLERADAAIAQKGPVAALFLDLDGFKPVNDTYGHAAGDALLAEVGARLIAATRPEDFVSRFGGDEFLVLCRGLRDDDAAFAVADRVRHDLSQPYEVDGRTVTIGVSIGIAVLDEYADTAETLVHNADLALYEAKRSGRGRTERFTPELAVAG
ncbi:MAG: diguanylate cyclase [Actinoplanes sp.]